MQGIMLYHCYNQQWYSHKDSMRQPGRQVDMGHARGPWNVDDVWWTRVCIRWILPKKSYVLNGLGMTHLSIKLPCVKTDSEVHKWKHSQLAVLMAPRINLHMDFCSAILHGAGIFTYIKTFKMIQFCRCAYSSTMVRIWGLMLTLW